MEQLNFKLFERNTATPTDSGGFAHLLVLAPDFIANRLCGLRQLIGLEVHDSEDYETVKLDTMCAPVASYSNRMKLTPSSIYMLGEKHYILVDATARVALLDKSHYRRVARWFKADCPAFYLLRRGKGYSVVDFMPVAEVLVLQGRHAIIVAAR